MSEREKKDYYLIVQVGNENGRLIARNVLTGEKVTKPRINYPARVEAGKTGKYIARRKTKSGNFIWKLTNELPENYININFKSTTKNEEISVSEITDISSGQDIAIDINENIRKLLSDSFNRKPDNLVIAESSWKLGSRAVLRGHNILLLGHSGCGKTLTARSLAKGWERPFFKFNMGAMQDARSSLIGNTHYSPDKGTFFAGSDFVKAIQTPNAIILLDEITRMSHDAENIMMTILDSDQRYLRIDEDPRTPVIEVANGVSFCATANVGTEYTSTRILDRATKDRFSTIIEVPLLTDKEENNLLKKLFPDVNPNYLSAFAKIAHHTREDKKSNDPQYMTLISTRSTVQQAELARDGFYFSEIMEALVFTMFDNEGGTDSDRTKIRQFVQQYTNLDSENPLKVKQKKVEESTEDKRKDDLDDIDIESSAESVIEGQLFDPNEDCF